MSADTPTDDDLLEAARNGDEGALAARLERYRERLERMVRPTREAAARARATRPALKDDQGWERAEIGLLTAELDAVLPPGSK